MKAKGLIIQMLLSLLCFWLVHANEQAFAQASYPPHIPYGVDEGLPSSQVFYLTKDAKERIWVCTRAGIACYNGYEFKVFGEKDSLAGNTHFEIHEDREGRIWFGGMDCQFSYLENDTIRHYQFNKTIRDSIRSGLNLQDFGFNGDGELIFTVEKGTEARNIYKVDGQGNLTVVNFNDEFTSYCVVVQLASGTNILADYNKPLSLEYGIIFLDDQLNKKHVIKKEIPMPPKNYRHLAQALNFSEKGFCFVNTTRGLLKVDLNTNGVTVVENEKPIIILFRSPEDQLWAGIMSSGISVLDEDGHFIPKWEVPGNVSGMLTDYEGGLWISTLRKGISYFPNPEVQYFEAEGRSGYGLFRDHHGEFKVTFPDGSLWDPTRNTYDELPSESQKWAGAHFSYLAGPQRYYVRSEGRMFGFLDTNFRPIGETNGYYNGTINGDFGPYSYLIGGGTIAKVSVDGIVKNIKADFSPHGGARIDSSLTLIVTNEGLWKMENDSLSRLKSAHRELNGLIGTISPTASGLIFVKPYRGAPVFWDHKTDSVIHLRGLDRIQGNIQGAAYLGKDNHLWIATTLGLESFYVDNFELTQGLLIDQRLGLPSRELWNIGVTDGNLLAMGPKGLALLPNILDRKKLPPSPLYMTDVRINGEAISGSDNQFGPGKVDVQLNYHSVAFQKQPLYEFRLLGMGDDWESTSERTVHYRSLVPGDYIFELRIQGILADENTEALQYAFNISPHFYNTSWFKALIILGILIILVLVGRSWLNRFKKKLIFEQKLNQLQNEALRSQMNPHFVFNVLTSIQAFVIQKDHYLATVALSKFSGLIRTFLNHSRQEYISIEEEIALLTSYLEIEQYRFGEHLNFSISSEPDLDIHDTQIPTLLLQPIVENCVQHGLGQIDKGLITVSFEQTQTKELRVTVTDNGPGISSMSTEGVGLNILQRRLELLEETKKQKGRLHIENINIAGKNKHGTKVTLTVPQ